MTSGWGLEVLSGLDGGQGVELSAVCQKPAPSLSFGTKPGGKKERKIEVVAAEREGWSSFRSGT